MPIHDDIPSALSTDRDLASLQRHGDRIGEALNRPLTLAEQLLNDAAKLTAIREVMTTWYIQGYVVEDAPEVHKNTCLRIKRILEAP